MKLDHKQPTAAQLGKTVRPAYSNQDSVERYQTLFNSIDQGFCVLEVIFDDTGKPVDYLFLEANPVFEAMTGITNNAALSLKTARQLVPNLEDKWIEVYGNVALTGQAVRFIDNSEAMNRWFEVYACRLGGSGSRKVALLFTDITERKITEDTLRTSEKQLRLITDAIPLLVSYVDADHRYRFVNQSYTEWFGKSREEVLGKHISEVLGDVAYRALQPEIEKVFCGQEVIFERHIPYKSGARFIRVNYIPDTDSVTNQVRGFHAFVQDISESKLAEQRLRESENKYRMLIEQASDGIHTYDFDGNFIETNSKLCEMLGYTADELLQLNVKDLVPPEDLLAHPIRFDELRLGKTLLKERCLLRKDGGLIPVEISGRMIQEGVLQSIIRDITERKRAEEALRRSHEELELRVQKRTEELEKANKALEVEIAERRQAEEARVTILHQLVTAQEDERRRIARDLHDQFGQQMTVLRHKLEALKKMSSAHQELLKQVEETLTVVRQLDSDIDFLAWQIRPTVLDDLGIVAALDQYVRQWSAHTNIPVEFNADRFGRARLTQEAATNFYRIAQEALNNVFKHAQATSVNVLLEPRGHSTVLIIEDDGIGFDPDQQVHGGNGKKGMGLTGMKERAALVGGTLEIESARGKGTTVYATVRLVDEQK